MHSSNDFKQKQGSILPMLVTMVICGAAVFLLYWIVESHLNEFAASSTPATIELAQLPPHDIHLSSASAGLTFPIQRYERQRPLRMDPGAFEPAAGMRRMPVENPLELERAIINAKPGDIIELQAGHYRMPARTIEVTRPGEAQRPIYLRASKYGDGRLIIQASTGFRISAPYWVFENLNFIGLCGRSEGCRAALNITGRASAFVLRNSEMSEFDTPLRVTGSARGGKAPESGLVEYNRFYNRTARNTRGQVSMISIGQGADWTVRGNFIADFVKNHPPYVSYGIYFAGQPPKGIIEQNLLLCEHRLNDGDSTRVGVAVLGSTHPHLSRDDRDFPAQAPATIIRNNIIMNCPNDVGIYIAGGAHARIHNNLLYNNFGIDVRFAETRASIFDNIISGRLLERDGGNIQSDNNLVERRCRGEARSSCSLQAMYKKIESLDLRLQYRQDLVLGRGRQPPPGARDFCGRPIEGAYDLGPIQYNGGILCLAPPAL